MKVSEKAQFYLDRREHQKGSDFHAFLMAASVHDELVSELVTLAQWCYANVKDPAVTIPMNRAFATVAHAKMVTE